MQSIPVEIKLTYIIAFVILLLFVFFIIFIVVIYNKRQHIFLLQQELEKQLALQSERDRISSDMHDDLGSGLSSIKLISEMLKMKHTDTETKNDLNEIVDHAANLTESMREMVWSLNQRNDVLPKFVDYTVQHSKSFFEPSEINYKIVANDVLPEITISGFVRRNLFLSIKEIFNNIIKHSKATEAACTISLHDHKLSIIIQDNGKGMADNHQEGNGLYSIKKRIADCNGHIEWVNQYPGLKTTIEISL